MQICVYCFFSPQEIDTITKTITKNYIFLWASVSQLYLHPLNVQEHRTAGTFGGCGPTAHLNHRDWLSIGISRTTACNVMALIDREEIILEFILNEGIMLNFLTAISVMSTQTFSSPDWQAGVRISDFSSSDYWLMLYADVVFLFWAKPDFSIEILC